MKASKDLQRDGKLELGLGGLESDRMMEMAPAGADERYEKSDLRESSWWRSLSGRLQPAMVTQEVRRALEARA